MAKIKVNVKIGPTMEQIQQATPIWDAMSLLYREADAIGRKIELLNNAAIVLIDVGNYTEKNADGMDGGAVAAMRAAKDKAAAQIERLKKRQQAIFKRRYALEKQVADLEGWFNVCECGLHTPVSMMNLKDGLAECDGNPWRTDTHKDKKRVEVHLVYRPHQTITFKGA